MVDARARYPQLLKLGDRPTLVGHRCGDCGRRAFPPDPYGCEQCGAEPDRLQPITLEPVGTITALATVHRHHNPWPETPFTVASIVLDDGISLKGVLTGVASATTSTTDPSPAPGDRVRGVTVVAEQADDGTPLVDLHFVLERDRPGRNAPDRSEG